jgi:hypothetical protein
VKLVPNWPQEVSIPEVLLLGSAQVGHFRNYRIISEYGFDLFRRSF